MVTKVLERYESESGETAEIGRRQDGSISVTICGSRFETILDTTAASIDAAREDVKARLPKPYARTM